MANGNHQTTGGGRTPPRVCLRWIWQREDMLSRRFRVPSDAPRNLMQIAELSDDNAVPRERVRAWDSLVPFFRDFFVYYGCFGGNWFEETDRVDRSVLAVNVPFFKIIFMTNKKFNISDNNKIEIICVFSIFSGFAFRIRNQLIWKFSEIDIHATAHFV